MPRSSSEFNDESLRDLLSKMRSDLIERYPAEALEITKTVNTFANRLEIRLLADAAIIADFRRKKTFKELEDKLFSREHLILPSTSRPVTTIPTAPASPPPSTKKLGLIGKLGWLLAILMVAAFCVGIAHKYNRFPRTIRGYDVGTHLDSALELLRISREPENIKTEVPAPPPTSTPVSNEAPASEPAPVAPATEPTPPAQPSPPAEPISEPAPVNSRSRPLAVEPLALPASSPISSTAEVTSDSDADLDPLPPLPELPEETASDTAADNSLVEIVYGPVQAEPFLHDWWRVPVLRLRAKNGMREDVSVVTLKYTRIPSDTPGIVIRGGTWTKNELGEDRLILDVIAHGNANENKLRIHKIEWVR
jgi:hypothetical protein